MRGVAHNGQVQLPGEILHERRHGGDGELAPSIEFSFGLLFVAGRLPGRTIFSTPGVPYWSDIFYPSPGTTTPPTLDPRDPVYGGFCSRDFSELMCSSTDDCFDTKSRYILFHPRAVCSNGDSDPQTDANFFFHR